MEIRDNKLKHTGGPVTGPSETPEQGENNTRVFDIDVIFLGEFATNNKRLLLLTSSILHTSSVKI